jgi:hypothetical protein
MAIVNFINTKAKSKAALKKIINYVTQYEKTDEKLISGKDLLPECALSEMMMTKKQFNKTGGRQYLHMVQSFSPEENIGYEKVHEVALELADYFENFQVLVATHKDRKHIHSHFIINSVNFDNGLKFQQSFEQLQKVMDKSDEICKRHGLSVLEEREFGKRLSRNEFQVAKKGMSLKMKLIGVIRDGISETSSKEEFIHYMNSRGYSVNWQDSRKYITYTVPSGKKYRCNRLHDKKYTKEEMENVFNVRRFSGQEQREIDSFGSVDGLHVESRGMGQDDGYTNESSYSKARQLSRNDGRVSRATNASKSKLSNETGKSNGWKYRSDKIKHRDVYGQNGDEVSNSKFGKQRDAEETVTTDSRNESYGGRTNSISDIGYNFASLIAERDDDGEICHRTSRYAGDLTKEGKKEKALKDHNIWDEER